MNAETLIEKLHEVLHTQGRTEEEIAEIDKAYQYAKKLHEGQYRVSEEPYIIHPCEVALILADLRVDVHTIMAAFLHDVIEDTDTTPEQIQEEFGEDVKNIVEGVTKLGKYQYSIYVVHYVIIRILGLSIWKNCPEFISAHPIIPIISNLFVILSIGVFVYYMIELPCSKFLQEKLIRKNN